jgi:hypothetical protein
VFSVVYLVCFLAVTINNNYHRAAGIPRQKNVPRICRVTVAKTYIKKA